MSTGWWIIVLIIGCLFSGCAGFGIAAILSVTGDEDYIIIKEDDTYRQSVE